MATIVTLNLVSIMKTHNAVCVISLAVFHHLPYNPIYISLDSQERAGADGK